MKKIVLAFFLLAVSSWHFAPTVLAQTTACDLCGLCEGGVQPDDYLSCTQCLYDTPANLGADLVDPGDNTAPSGARKGYSWTVIGCLSTEPQSFFQQLLQFTVGIVGGIMFIAFLYGGSLILTSSGDPGRIAQGKKILTSSIVALLVVIFSVFILQVVGFDIIKIPGFG